jgi:hypothetical protein
LQSLYSSRKHVEDKDELERTGNEAVEAYFESTENDEKNPITSSAVAL